MQRTEREKGTQSGRIQPNPKREKKLTFFGVTTEGLARVHRTASRPLDGGVLSRGRARAPARSHVVAPSSLIHQHSKEGIKKEKDDRERWPDLARRSAPSSAPADCRGGAPWLSGNEEGRPEKGLGEND